jgi:hypothetical protein
MSLVRPRRQFVGVAINSLFCNMKATLLML